MQIRPSSCLFWLRRARRTSVLLMCCSACCLPSNPAPPPPPPPVIVSILSLTFQLRNWPLRWYDGGKVQPPGPRRRRGPPAPLVDPGGTTNWFRVLIGPRGVYGGGWTAADWLRSASSGPDWLAEGRTPQEREKVLIYSLSVLVLRVWRQTERQDNRSHR